MAKLLYQGHASFRIITDGGTVVYVDPYAGKGYDVPADLVLVSHEHPDHNVVELVTLKPGGKILRSSDLLSGGQYGSFLLKEVEVRATPAYNRNHARDACVGFLISTDGRNVYAAGDTSKTDYMSEVLAKKRIDYALLPIDGVYNMDAKEASSCAAVIGAEHSIPIHMKPGALFDAARAEAFQAAGRLILKPGTEIKL